MRTRRRHEDLLATAVEQIKTVKEWDSSGSDVCRYTYRVVPRVQKLWQGKRQIPKILTALPVKIERATRGRDEQYTDVHTKTV